MEDWIWIGFGLDWIGIFKFGGKSKYLVGEFGCEKVRRDRNTTS